jgi:Protein of unknown function (DUF4232)
MRAAASILGGVAFGVVGATQGAHPSACVWRLSNGPLWSEKTGQHTATFVVRNRSSASCVLRGYPRVELLDGHGRMLPFTYAHRGDQMISAAPARRVRVRAGRAAYFAANKYRCDTRTRAVARLVRVTVPGSTASLTIRLGRYPIMDFCGRGAPSGIVTVSPIVASLAAAAARP